MKSQNINLSEHHTAKFDENQDGTNDLENFVDTKSRKSNYFAHSLK